MFVLWERLLLVVVKVHVHLFARWWWLWGFELELYDDWTVGFPRSVTGSNSCLQGVLLDRNMPDNSWSGTHHNISPGTFSDPYESKLYEAFICSLMTRSISPVTPHGAGGKKNKKKVLCDLFRTAVN